MNQETNLGFALDAKTIHRAKKQAAMNARPFMAELQLLTGQTAIGLLSGLANLFSMRSLTMQAMMDLRPIFKDIPLPLAMVKRVILFKSSPESDESLIAVISDPTDLDLQTWIISKLSQSVVFALALDIDIHAFLVQQEDSSRAVDQIHASPEEKSDRRDPIALSFSSVTAESNPAIKLVNSTLFDGLKCGASDIHVETTGSGLTIKYRIDGVLDNATNIIGVENAERVISRLKVLSELDISERRIPQDGSFRVRLDEREVDLRISIMPSIFGEDAVIRILDKRSMVEAYGALTLEALGFDVPSLNSLRQLTQEAYGMLMVTGPTGSGKTTTLYAALTEINSGKEKIITIEDPVEYQLSGILQIPVNEKKGLTFAKGLRSILRHDPDKIMVGEIRDKETAEIAVQSALTGHLVLTTVHANNVFDVFGRFTHLGTDLYAFASALNGVWAQRLVRVNCSYCAQSYIPSDIELQRIKLTREDAKSFQFKHGIGCTHCRGTGFRGRKAIAEILTLNDEIREMIIDKKPIRQFKELARQNGTRSLRESALELIKMGETTPDEIKRVTLYA